MILLVLESGRDLDVIARLCASRIWKHGMGSLVLRLLACILDSDKDGIVVLARRELFRRRVVFERCVPLLSFLFNKSVDGFFFFFFSVCMRKHCEIGRIAQS